MNKNLVFGSAMFVVGISSFLYSSWDVFWNDSLPSVVIASTAPEYSVPPSIKASVKPYAFTEVQKAYNEGRFASVAQALENKKGTLTEEEYILLAQSQKEMGETDSAKQTIQKALTTSPSPIVLSTWITLSLEEGNIVESRTILQEFSEGEELHYFSTIIALAEKNYEEAKKHLLELKTSTKYAVEYKTIQNIFTTYDSFSDGSPYFLDVMAANTLRTLKFYNLTLPILKIVLEESPEYRDAWIVMGSSYLSLKRFDVAESMLEKAISLDPTHPQSPYLLGLALSELQLSEDALIQFERAIQNGYEPKEKVLRAKADVFLRTNQYQKALDEYQNIIQNGKNPLLSDYTKAISLSVEQLGNPSVALSFIEKAKQMFPQNASLGAQEALVLWKNNRAAEAKMLLQQNIQLSPEDAENYLYLGQIVQSEGDISGAIDHYRTCYEKGNGNAFASECAIRYNTLQ